MMAPPRTLSPVVQDIHGYAQLAIAGRKPGPARVVTVDAMRDPRAEASSPAIHLKVSDVVIAGNFELDIMLTATQSANLGSQLRALAKDAQRGEGF